jgi:hypothetical protein
MACSSSAGQWSIPITPPTGTASEGNAARSSGPRSSSHFLHGRVAPISCSRKAPGGPVRSDSPAVSAGTSTCRPSRGLRGARESGAWCSRTSGVPLCERSPVESNRRSGSSRLMARCFSSDGGRHAGAGPQRGDRRGSFTVPLDGRAIPRHGRPPPSGTIILRPVPRRQRWTPPTEWQRSPESDSRETAALVFSILAVGVETVCNVEWPFGHSPPNRPEGTAPPSRAPIASRAGSRWMSSGAEPPEPQIRDRPGVEPEQAQDGLVPARQLRQCD